MDRKTLKRFFKIAIPVFAFSAIVDYLLWFINGFHVPSWAIATMSTSYAILLTALYKIL